MKKLESLIARADELLALGDQVRATASGDGSNSSVDTRLFYNFRSAGLSFLLKVFGAAHPYYTEYNGKVKNSGMYSIDRGLGMLEAVKVELKGGWLETTKGLVSAEIFSDFIEMSEHLLEEGYKDAAAVMIGSVLEQHLRELCDKHSIDTFIEKDGERKPFKADRLNAELAKAKIYSKLDQKNITAWLGLRNNAAHGKYNEYEKDQVDVMVRAVTDFMSRLN